MRIVVLGATGNIGSQVVEQALAAGHEVVAMFEDKALSEAILPGTGLRWTVAYPVNLRSARALPSEAVEPLDEVGKVPGLPTLPFANAGRALVEIATNQEHVGKRLLVTTPSGWRPPSR